MEIKVFSVELYIGLVTFLYIAFGERKSVRRKIKPEREQNGGEVNNHVSSQEIAPHSKKSEIVIAIEASAFGFYAEGRNRRNVSSAWFCHNKCTHTCTQYHRL